MNPEDVLSLCLDKLTFVKNQKRSFKARIRHEPNHLQTQLAILYANEVLKATPEKKFIYDRLLIIIENQRKEIQDLKIRLSQMKN